MANIACDPKVDSACIPVPDYLTLIPAQYQGWLFFIFMIIGFIAVVVGFYLIATGWGEPEPIKLLETRSKKGGKNGN